MRFPLLGLILYCGLLFFCGLGDRDLVSSHEARAAQNAQVILDEGRWLVPQLFDQHLELQKPPMYYWLVALIAWLKGGPVDAWAVRLPAALSAFATILFVYFLGARTGRKTAGFIAATMLASCLHFTWLARVGRIDMPLTLAITVALGAFRLGNLAGVSRKQRLLWHALGYAALGMGLLLKGPIAAILPAVVAGACWLRHKVRNRQRRVENRPASSLWWGIPSMLAIAAPWYVAANGETNNRLWEVFFWHHNIERGLGGAEALATHPWWLYFPRVIVDLLPWNLTVPFAARAFWRDAELRQDEDACDGLLWFVGMLLFLSCMSFKRADYLLPAYPGLAIFLGAWAERWWRARLLVAPRGAVRFAQRGFLGVILTYGAGWLVHQYAFASSPETEWPYRRMAREIRRQTQGPIVFFRAESHLLAYHVGQPLATILEWENLDVWTNKSFPVYIVMPEKCVPEWRRRNALGTLQEVLRTSDFAQGKHDRPLVVLRNR